MTLKLFAHHYNWLELEFARLAYDIIWWLHCADDFILVDHCKPSLVIG